MRIERQIATAMIVLLFGALASGASADVLRGLVNEGNRLLTEKKYDEALEKYRSAQVESPESPYLYFNIGDALQHQGKFDDAMNEYRKVYSRQKPWLGAWALYNIGVCQYRQAEQAIGTQDYQKALGLLEQCMESNREAMKIAPADEDPKFNYEQAKRKWKEVLDALKKQQEEQKKQQEQQQKQQGDQQKQDQQKQEQQKQEQQKQEQQKQEQEKQQPKSDLGTSQTQNQEKPSSGTAEAQQQPKTGEMTPEDAERILNSLPEQNADDMRRFLTPRGRPDYRIEKDW
jgi:Tfp pilus assembly protein PilF